MFYLAFELHDGRALSADSEEKHEPASDIDIAKGNSLKVLDLERPIREADIGCHTDFDRTIPRKMAFVPHWWQILCDLLLVQAEMLAVSRFAKQSSMKSIAFVSTSKGRLHHIKQTLPLMVAQGVAEVIIVDYGCPDRTGDWVEANFPNVTVVRVNDDPGFCPARARNLGAEQANAEWLVFIDGDIKAAPGWGAWMQQHLKIGCFYRPVPVSEMPDTYGTVICARSDFEAIGGYDEVFTGWGGEDDELYQRLKRHGIVEQDYPSEFVSAIPHGDEERAGWAGMRSKEQKQTLGRCYRSAKVQAAKFIDGSGDLPFDVRTDLMKNTEKALLNWFADGASKPLTIRYVLDCSRPPWLPAPGIVKPKLEFAICIKSPLPK